MAGSREREAVVAQIAKLLALAENQAATPGEAATAAAAAGRLMAKYAIERHVVDRRREVGDDDGDLVDEKDPLWSGRRRSLWREYLAEGIARAHSCRTLISQGDDVCIVILGYSSDIQVVRYLFTYLEKEIDRLARSALRAGKVCGHRGGFNFRYGASAMVVERLHQMRDEAKKNFIRDRVAGSVDRGRAIVEARGVVTRAIMREREKTSEVLQMIARNYNAEKVHVDREFDPAAYAQGRRAGSQLGLRRGLKS